MIDEKTKAPDWSRNNSAENDFPQQDVEATIDASSCSGKEFRSEEKILGKYTVLSLLGRGAMGAVYKCFDHETRREIAIKAFSKDISHDFNAISRIISNFQLVEKLNHPNIANLKQLVKDPQTGFYYLLMEYVPGSTLTEFMKHKQVSPEQKKAVLMQIADALDFVHAKKLIHRDIKPDNIIITADGEVKLLDFGIATQVIDTAYEQTSNDFCGTAHYIAPELWKSDPAQKITPAVDRYSLAVIVFEMTYNRRPFTGDSVEELKEKVTEQEIPFPAHAAYYEKHVLKKALAKAPEERYGSGREFIETFFTKPFYYSYKFIFSAAAVLLLAIAAICFICRPEPVELPILNPPAVPANTTTPSMPATAAAPASTTTPAAADASTLPTGRTETQKQVIKLKKSPRLLIRCKENIRNLKSEKLSQGLLQELALNYGFQTVNPEYVKNKNAYDFVIDVRFTGGYRSESFSFNKNLKLHAFSLGADLSATTPDGLLITQVTLPGKDFRIGRIGDPQEALRDCMRRRITAKDEVSFHNILLKILEKWCQEVEQGMLMTVTVKDASDIVNYISSDILGVLKAKNLLLDYTIRTQDESGNIYMDITSKLQSMDIANMIVMLSRKNLKIESVEYGKITLERK